MLNHYQEDVDIYSNGVSSDSDEGEGGKYSSRECDSFRASVQMAKLAANAFTEQKRRGDSSPTKFLEFKNARVVHQDKYLDEITLAIDKPEMPAATVAFGPQYYKLDKYTFGKKNQEIAIEYSKKEEKLRLKAIKEFYRSKGIKNEGLIDELIKRSSLLRQGLIDKWWISLRKRNFLEMLDEYKYPLQKIFSHD